MWWGFCPGIPPPPGGEDMARGEMRLESQQDAPVPRFLVRDLGYGPPVCDQSNKDLCTMICTIDKIIPQTDFTTQ
jgi:hypothetical protein